MAFCSRCGARIPEGGAFCTACGAPVSTADTGYQQFRQQPFQQAYQQPVSREIGGYRANIRRRDLVIAILLSLITFGIYGLIWFFWLVEDLNTASQTPDDQTPGMVLLLSIITCGIYGLIWLYHAGDKVDRIRQMNGELPSNSALIYLLVSLFGFSIVAYALIQNELNKVAVYS